MLSIDMAKLTKEQLLSNIKELLEMPGVCVQEKRTQILDLCQTLSEEDLGKIAATLRIRYRSLLRLARSPEKRQEIQGVKNEIDTLLQKYGIQS